MKEVTDSIEWNQTRELVDLLCGHRLIDLHYVYKLKKNEVVPVMKHKVRLDAKGYVQQYGIDFEEVFDPVARLESVQLMLVGGFYTINKSIEFTKNNVDRVFELTIFIVLVNSLVLQVNHGNTPKMGPK